MIKPNKKQLAFDDDAFPVPEVNHGSKQSNTPQSPQNKTTKIKRSIPTTLQPFLPGLSRRGRPRSANPISPTVRASESRKRRIETGARRIELLLAPNIAADLDALIEHYKLPRVEIIARLVTKAARRIPGKN